MRLGMLPSQRRELQKAFKKARAFDSIRSRTRRALRLPVGSMPPTLNGAIVRTGLAPTGMAIPASGDVLPHLLPVLCLRAQ